MCNVCTEHCPLVTRAVNARAQAQPADNIRITKLGTSARLRITDRSSSALSSRHVSGVCEIHVRTQIAANLLRVREQAFHGRAQPDFAVLDAFLGVPSCHARFGVERGQASL